MALPATHVRYALEKMPISVVSQKDAYLAGTLYPDSRMLTGLPRDRTHADHCLKEGFATSPFRLGWQLHCHCDLVQAEVHARIWPRADRRPEPRRWIAMSAAKMVQDEANLIACPLSQHLAGLNCARPPLGEAPDSVEAFYAMIRDLYANTEISSQERFARLWAGVGLDQDLIQRLMRAYMDLKAHPELAERLAGSMSSLLTHRLPAEPLIDQAHEC